jgi:hypothetical protein
MSFLKSSKCLPRYFSNQCPCKKKNQEIWSTNKKRGVAFSVLNSLWQIQNLFMLSSKDMTGIVKKNDAFPNQDTSFNVMPLSL